MTKTADGTRKVPFSITARDIGRARRKDPERCAAALALKRQLGADRVEVHLTRTYVERGGKRQRFETPVALKQEIVAIDRGGRFEPGAYILKPIPRSQTERVLASTNKARKPRRSRPVKHRRPTPNVRGRGHGR